MNKLISNKYSEVDVSLTCSLQEKLLKLNINHCPKNEVFH